jgi:hypothetical protein
MNKKIVTAWKIDHDPHSFKFVEDVSVKAYREQEETTCMKEEKRTDHDIFSFL